MAESYGLVLRITDTVGVLLPDVKAAEFDSAGVEVADVLGKLLNSNSRAHEQVVTIDCESAAAARPECAPELRGRMLRPTAVAVYPGGRCELVQVLDQPFFYGAKVAR